MALEQDIELTRKTYETQFEGPFRSVTEKENNGNESGSLDTLDAGPGCRH